MEVCMEAGHKHMNLLGTKYDMYAKNYKHGHITHLVVCFTNQLKKMVQPVQNLLQGIHIWEIGRTCLHNTPIFTDNYVSIIVITMVQT